MIKNLLPKNNILYILMTICLAGVAMSCNKETPAPPAPAPTAAKPAQQAVKPVQKPVSSAKNLPQSTTGLFDFSNKKDPFKPFVVAKQVESPASLKKQLRSGLPIHQYDVNQFRLIGVVSGSGESKAMVVDPNGKGYVLKIGMTIGKSDGKVTAINSAGVVVTEQFKDDNGRVRSESIKITLPKKM